MFRIQWLLLVVACFTIPSWAATMAPPEPSGSACLGLSCANFSVFTLGKITVLSADFSQPDWSLTGSATVNPDPFLFYSFTFTNHSSSTQTYNATLTLPYSGGPYIFGMSRLTSSVQDGGDGSVSVSGLVQQPNYDGHQFGLITGGCTVAGGFCFGSALTDIPLNPVSSAAGTLAIDIAVTLSAHDTIDLSGRAEIYNPEPATVWMFSIFLAGVAARRLVRR